MAAIRSAQRAFEDRGETAPGQPEIVESWLDALADSNPTMAVPGNPQPEASGAVRRFKPANLDLHDKLETILNSGDLPTINAVVPNIEIFFARLQPATARRVAGK